jgi:hypothetical protein
MKGLYFTIVGFFLSVKRHGWRFAIGEELLAWFCAISGAKEVDIKYFEK